MHENRGLFLFAVMKNPAKQYAECCLAFWLDLLRVSLKHLSVYHCSKLAFHEVPCQPFSFMQFSVIPFARMREM